MLTRTWRRWPATSNGAFSAPRMRPAAIVAAAEARDRVAVVHGAVEARGDLDQQPVAGLVPEPVVDDLEVVEVQEQHRDAFVRLHRGAQGVQERRPVGQTGQCIEPGRRVEGQRGHDFFINRPLRRRFERLRTLGARP
jgi:hypothetical protein